jgi:KDO2-lipid IV(A) lauroyltransferase
VAAKTDTATVGAEHIDAALERGRGAILALPHSGNWDVAGVWLIARHGPFTTVAERLKPESLFNRFLAYREGLGMEIIPLTGGERPPTDVLTERLRANRVVCLLADRDLSRNGVQVDFFGEPTRMPGGPSLLAATTGAALLPVHLWYTPDGWAQTIAPPVELPEGSLRERVAYGTQCLADFFAAEIAKHPVDWHMLQKLWLADLSPRAAAAVRA